MGQENHVLRPQHEKKKGGFLPLLEHSGCVGPCCLLLLFSLKFDVDSMQTAT